MPKSNHSRKGNKRNRVKAPKVKGGISLSFTTSDKLGGPQ